MRYVVEIIRPGASCAFPGCTERRVGLYGERRIPKCSKHCLKDFAATSWWWMYESRDLAVARVTALLITEPELCLIENVTPRFSPTTRTEEIVFTLEPKVGGPTLAGEGISSEGISSDPLTRHNRSIRFHQRRSTRPTGACRQAFARPLAEFVYDTTDILRDTHRHGAELIRAIVCLDARYRPHLNEVASAFDTLCV